MSVEQAQAGPTQTADQRSIWVIFSGLMLALLISSLDQTVVATALPTIVSDLGGLSQLSWVVTGYLLASTVSTPLWGKLGDLYGRKRLFQAAIVIFLVGSALCGLSQNMTELILFRSLQGLGGGGLIVLVQAIIGDIVPPRERGRYQGLFGAVFGLSSVAGPLLVGFVVAEQHAAEPVVPLQLFRNPVFSLSCAIGFVVGFALFGATTYLPLFLQVVNGASPTNSGLRLLPMILGLLLTSTTSGQLISRWGRYKAFPIAGTALMTLGMFLLSRMNEQTSVLVSSLFMLVLGLGLGLVMQVLVIAVQNAVDYRNLGAATSGVTFFRSIGGSFGTAIFGAIF